MHRCPSPCCHTPAAFALLPCFFLRIPILSCSFCPSFDVLLLLHVLRCSAYAAHSPMLCSCRISSDVLPHISLLHPSYSTVKFDNKSNPSKKMRKKTPAARQCLQNGGQIHRYKTIIPVIPGHGRQTHIGATLAKPLPAVMPCYICGRTTAPAARDVRRKLAASKSSDDRFHGCIPFRKSSNIALQHPGFSATAPGFSPLRSKR